MEIIPYKKETWFSSFPSMISVTRRAEQWSLQSYLKAQGSHILILE